MTMADERQRLFGGALPLDDVDSSDIELAGRVAEFLERLQVALDLLERNPRRQGVGRHAGPHFRFAHRHVSRAMHGSGHN